MVKNFLRDSLDDSKVYYSGRKFEVTKTVRTVYIWLHRLMTLRKKRPSSITVTTWVQHLT